MALEFNYGDAYSADVQKPVTVWKWTSAFREIFSQNGTGRITDIKAPLGLDTTIKYQTTRIANVYDTLAKGSIPAINRDINITGSTVFTELTTVLTQARQDQPDVLVPVVARIELRLPHHPEMTDEVVAQILSDTLGTLCDSEGNVDVASRLRGTSIPHEVI